MKRTALVRSLAKINLDLRVLHKRPDGYHELRTVFQSISLADRLRISFEKARCSAVTVTSDVEIPGINIAQVVSQAILEQSSLKGLIQIEIEKRIPMGGGLGGGSSNAAAVLLALPALMGWKPSMVQLESIAAKLGSDITFFLYGGAALGLGRGTDLYPLPDVNKRTGILAASGIHVSTADAYRGLQRTALETATAEPAAFRQTVWNLDALQGCRNDFEDSVYRVHPKLRAIHRALESSGAETVRMSGSGSTIFALGGGKPPGRSSILETCRVYPFETVSRRQYQSLWRRQLKEHIQAGELWPPLSRYAR